jgi:predicted HicB family RNase H-like nuclease
MPDATHYTYRVAWSVEDGEHIATVAEFPSLSWLVVRVPAQLHRRLVREAAEQHASLNRLVSGP